MWKSLTERVSSKMAAMKQSIIANREASSKLENVSNSDQKSTSQSNRMNLLERNLLELE